MIFLGNILKRTKFANDVTNSSFFLSFFLSFFPPSRHAALRVNTLKCHVDILAKPGFRVELEDWIAATNSITSHCTRRSLRLFDRSFLLLLWAVCFVLVACAPFLFIDHRWSRGLDELVLLSAQTVESNPHMGIDVHRVVSFQTAVDHQFFENQNPPPTRTVLL